MDKFSEMSHADRIAYLASKVALAKSYDSPVLTVPIPDLEILLAELEASQKALKGVTELWNDQRQRIAELGGVCSDASQVLKEIGNELGCNPDNESIMMAIDELKAQVKVWESAAMKHLARAEEAEKRLPILEQDKLRLNEIINSEANRADEAEKLLATPVRLPDSFYPDGDIDCPLVVELDEAVEAIRAAGFTVEGD
ncbi:hypothetical protein [Serratia marcescens]|uniref:hypothetical protein n=1 Tax=Serratia marcescens TaxID=615 RepID=UPI00202AB4CB|nr:hypothetical protein [Serratia marcescens]